MASRRPAVTAFMTVYNAEATVAASLASLLDQTLDDIEVVCVDDGSTDATLSIMKESADRRVRILSPGRIGRARALVAATQAARGRYLANLDADDLAFPRRLEQQLAFLEAEPEVAWLGVGEERVDSQRGEHIDRYYPTSDSAIRRLASKCIPYTHSGIMFRREIVDQGINYDVNRLFLIDFAFFIEVARRWPVANLPGILVRRHLHDDSYFQATYPTALQNRELARLCLAAAAAFRLPPWYFAFPAARFAYPALPDPIKRVVRRATSLREAAPSTR